MTHDTHAPNGRAVVAARSDTAPADTTEIAALAEAAGYDVVGHVSQVRAEDPGMYLGRGKVDEIDTRCRERDADAVIVDGELTPGQHRNLREFLPEGTYLLDRHRLVLDIFADQATDRRAQLQVERAQLEYELARFELEADENAMTRFTEKGSRRYDLEDRIAALDRTLAELPEPGERIREQRRDDGFDLVTIAGYTNAGKSTLLHRLADDLSVSTPNRDHPDVDGVAEVADHLFKTLETTTRRATLRDRPMLVTDTVGYVRDLPHELVVSFSETLSEAAAADVVVLLADASDDPDELSEKLRVSYEVLDHQSVDPEAIVLGLNKVDTLDADALDEAMAVAGEFDDDPVGLSALEGDNVEALIDRIVERVPTTRETLELPPDDAAMGVVSDAYDRAVVHDVDYGESITLDVEGRPAVIESIRHAAANIG